MIKTFFFLHSSKFHLCLHKKKKKRKTPIPLLIYFSLSLILMLTSRFFGDFNIVVVIYLVGFRIRFVTPTSTTRDNFNQRFEIYFFVLHNVSFHLLLYFYSLDLCFLLTFSFCIFLSLKMHVWFNFKKNAVWCHNESFFYY